MEELIARLRAGAEGQDPATPGLLALLGGEREGVVPGLPGGGGFTGGGGAASTWQNPGLASGSGGSTGRGDVGLWGGQEVTGATFPGRGEDYTGPVIRRRRTSPDSPFQVFPVPGGEYVSSYGAPRTGHLHQGNDIMAEAGTPIYAPFGGQVEYAPNAGTAGNAVWVDNPRYGAVASFHNQPFTPDLPEEGARVRPGDLIGYVGDTGNALGGPPHSHFEYQPGGAHSDAVDPYGELSSIASLIDTALEDYSPNLARYSPQLLRRLEAGEPEAVVPSTTTRRRRRGVSPRDALLRAAHAGRA